MDAVILSLRGLLMRKEVFRRRAGSRMGRITSKASVCQSSSRTLQSVQLIVTVIGNRRQCPTMVTIIESTKACDEPL